MSAETGSFWVSLMEKVFGLLLIAVSLLVMYFTFTSVNVLGVFTGFFGFLSVVLLIAGGFLIIVKPPE